MRVGETATDAKVGIVINNARVVVNIFLFSVLNMLFPCLFEHLPR